MPLAYLPAAKSANQFTQDDLKYFRIEFNDQTRDEFFDRIGDLDDPDERSLIGFCSWQSLNDVPTTADEDSSEDASEYSSEYYAQGYMAQLLYDLEVVTSDDSLESNVDFFSKDLLRCLGYNAIDQYRWIFPGPKMMPLEICGQWRSARVNVHVATFEVNNHEDALIKYLQINKRGGSKADPEPQLMANAVAAFAINERHSNDPDPNLKLDFPCLTMRGSYPTFYRITVSRALKNAFAAGEKPAQPTVVRRFNPIPPDDRMMNHLPYRREVVRCLSEFKRFVLM